MLASSNYRNKFLCKKKSVRCALYHLQLLIYPFLKMDTNRNKRKLNKCWRYDETITLLRTMKNFQLLWIPHIFRKEEYQTAIKTAQRRLVELNKRPWMDIFNHLTCLRSRFKGGISRNYYDEMICSMTVDGEVRRRNIDV